ncbi:MAG: hypothetical protein HQL99_02990 [Magnetococcales bacterium]|nr:hypothetical protein [Magnetococcales bacterium]
MRPVDLLFGSGRRVTGHWSVPFLFVWCVLVILGGCTDPVEDPLLVTLISKDTTLETLQRYVRPRSYWTAKVELLEKRAEEARVVFQGHHDAYRTGLLSRREAVQKAVQEARTQKGETDEARQEAIQKHRTALAHSRDEAREAGRELRVRLALLRKAREQLERVR